MEINVDNRSRQVEIWLTKAEKMDTALREQLRPVCAGYHRKKYQVVVYESGSGDLQESILGLLRCNRQQLAELDMQKSSVNGMS